MSNHDELIERLRASAAAMPFDAAVAVQYRAAADALEAQAQAGAVPLTDEQLAEMMRETWGCASIAPRHAMKFARAIEAAHGIGIKGGQHGAE